MKGCVLRARRAASKPWLGLSPVTLQCQRSPGSPAPAWGPLEGPHPPTAGLPHGPLPGCRPWTPDGACGSPTPGWPTQAFRGGVRAGRRPSRPHPTVLTAPGPGTLCPCPLRPLLSAWPGLGTPGLNSHLVWGAPQGKGASVHTLCAPRGHLGPGSRPPPGRQPAGPAVLPPTVAWEGDGRRGLSVAGP